MRKVAEMNAAMELKQLLLRAPRLTLAVAESLTAGNVQARVASVSGSSDYFLGGITAYSLDEKVRHLGVARAAAKKVNCVSAEVAEQMACGVCKLFGSDVGIGTTGYAEPNAKLEILQPFAWWAVAHRGPRGKLTVRHGRIECVGASRTDAQRIVADAALAELVSLLRARRGEKVEG
jgi:nicotinamide-nucleotide amidase